MQKKTKKISIILFIIMVTFFMIFVMSNKSIVYAEGTTVGQTWKYQYEETEAVFNDQQFLAPVTGVYEIKAYGETNAKVNLRVKDSTNPDTLVTSYQIQGGKGGMVRAYIKLNEGESIFIHTLEGNSAGQIEQTTTQLQNKDLSFGNYCIVSKTGTQNLGGIYQLGDSFITANAGGYHCTDYENGNSIDGGGTIKTELCPEVTYNGITYASEIQSGVAEGNTHCIITLKATEDNKIAYTVNHWKQNLNGEAEQHNSDNYTLEETEDLVGTIGESVSPETKSYTGFTSPVVQTVEMNAGNITINYYYARTKYNFTLGECEGVTTTGSTPSGSYMYGSTIILKAKVQDGYTWSKWSNNDSKLETTLTMPAEDLNISPIATKNSEKTTGEKGSSTPSGDDLTTAKGTLPQTGITMTIVFSILITIIIGAIFYIKYRNFKDIN